MSNNEPDDDCFRREEETLSHKRHTYTIVIFIFLSLRNDSEGRDEGSGTGKGKTCCVHTSELIKCTVSWAVRNVECEQNVFMLK
jgi:hypothetical protein